ncbi:MAG: response regulator transcription factor [Halioglobus sp.]
MKNSRLIIVDDHPIFREGLKQIIARVPGIEVVAEADTGDAALAQIQQLSPDVVTLDIAMPGKDGLQVLEMTRSADKVPLVIVITSYDDNAYLNKAFELGARAYVLKDSALTDVVDCLRAVLDEKIFISPSLGRSKPLLPDMDDASVLSVESLTNMEQLVLRGVSEFKTSKEIAKKLDVSYRTIQNHRSNICSKLGLRGAHQLLNFSCENAHLIVPNV